MLTPSSPQRSLSPFTPYGRFSQLPSAGSLAGSLRAGRAPGFRYLLVLVALLSGALALAGCGGGFGEFKPAITSQLANVTVKAGQTATFTVAATGNGPLSYSWAKNGAPLPGVTGTTYSMVAQATDNGAKMLVNVSNAGGTSTSTATLTVESAPVITQQPASQTVAAGATATFTVAASGTGPLTYQWFRNGAAIAGATATSYTTAALTTPDSGASFSAVVSNAIGTANSAAATLTITSLVPALAFAPVAPQTFGAAGFPVTASSASPGTVTYTVVSGPATIAGNVVTATGVGNVVLSASQAAAGNYTAATTTTTFAVTPQVPTLAFAPVGSQSFGGAAFPVTASSASSGAITYTVVSGPATISGNLVTLTGSGAVVLGASQAAAGNYAAATATTTLNAGTQTPTLTFAPIGAQAVGNAPFPVTATSASPGAVSYTVTSGPATIAGNVVTVTGTGTVMLGATQAASGGYAAATATTSFSVTPGQAPTIAFNVANQTLGAAPFPVAATSNSTGAITYSVTSGPATVAGNVVTLTGTGTVVLGASQAGAGSYTTGTASATFTVAAQAPTLSFNVAGQTYGEPPFQVNATSNSQGAITYAVVSGPATIAGNTVTLTGTGNVVLSASQAANGNYAAAAANATFAVSAATSTLTFNVAGQTFGEPPFAVNATSASPGAISYAVVSGPATVAGNTVTLTGTGNVVLSASQAASGNYAASTADASFAVAAATPTLTFNVAGQTFGEPPFAVNATSASSGAITYAVVSGPATVAGNMVTLTGSGTVVLSASQAANGNYAAATANATFAANPGSLTLTFNVAGQTYGEPPFAVNATSASSGAITYTVVSGPATVAGNTVTLTGTGTVVLSASQAASGSYAAATATATFTAAPETPTLSFSVPNQTVGTPPFPVNATSPSTGAVTYAVTSGPATVSGNVVTVSAPGTVVMSASQAASGNYAAATATTSFTVSSGQSPNLAFSIASQTYGSAPFAVNATSSSTGAITYAVASGPATVAGNTVTVTGTGTVVMTASQVSQGTYAAASTTATFSVSPATPTLSFAPIAAQTFGAPAFAVSATSASSGAVTFSVVSGPATVAGNMVSLTGAGTVILNASQAATADYTTANATTTFSISAETPTLVFAPIPAESFGGAPFTVSATSASSGLVTYAVVSGPATVSGNTVTLTGSGTVVLSASQAPSGSYGSAVATTTITAGAEVPTLTFNVANQTFGAAPFPVNATSASAGAITYVVTSGPATIAGNTVTLTGTGAVVLTATQAADGNYASGSAAATFSVAAETPTLTFNVANQIYGASPFAVNATSASSGAITYAVTSGPATVSGNTVTLTGTGTVVLSASQAAAGNFAAATASASFTVTAAAPSLTFNIANQTFGSAPFPVNATTPSSGAITYTVVSGPATVSGNTVTLTGVGNVVMTANLAAAGNYAAATATTNFTVAPEVPTLNFTIPNQTFSSTPFSIGATSASSGAITYAVTSGPATVSGSQLTMTGTGSVVVSASQAASGNYAATSASTSFSIAAQGSALSFQVSNKTFGDLPFPVNATSSSPGAVTYAVVSGPATVVGNLVTLTGAGTVVMSASQVASGTYAAATASATFTVAPEIPTLSFGIAGRIFGALPFPVSATSPSSGAITYVVTSGSATILGNTVTLTGTGAVVITASQAASGNYAAATASTSFTVSAETPTLALSIPDKVFGVAPFPVTATSPSSGAILYTITGGPAAILGNTVALTGIGQVTVTAIQTPAGNYAAATVSATFNVTAETPTITFNVANQTFGAAPFAVDAVSNSIGALTYTVASGPATISGNTVTLTGAGTVVIGVSQAASGNYAAGNASATFTVAAGTPTLSFSVPNQTFGAVPFAVNATSPSAGAITYAVTSGPATISGNTVTLTGVGTVVLNASQAANGNYAAGNASATFTVAAETPTLTFSIPNQTFGAAPFAVNATSNSTGALTYSIVSGPATISGNTVTVTGTGSVVVGVAQAAAGNFTAGSGSATFTVAPAAPTLSFNVPNQTFGAVPFTVAATSPSTGAITYSVVSGPAAILNHTVTLTGVGTVVLQATQAASGNYAAGSAQATFTVAPAAPIIVFSVSNRPYSSTPFAVSATSDSTGAFTYTVTSGPATISGNNVTLTGIGTVTLQASQAAAGNYGAGTASTTFTVSAVAPTLTFNVPTQTYSTTPFAVAANSNSTGAITYSVVSGPATVSGSNVTLTGIGSVTLQATQVASGDYAAGSAQATFTVNATAPTLTFNVPNKTYSSTPFAVAATSNSGGVITYSVVSGPATVSGGNVTLTGLGTVVLQASQAASGNYAAATAQATFTVSGQAPTIALNVPNKTYGAAPFTVNATSNSTGAFTYTVTSGPATVSGNTVTLTGVGTVVLGVSQAAAGTYTAGTASATFAVASEAPSIAFAVANQTYSTTPFTVNATSNSLGAFTYTVTSGPATISGNTVTMTGAGTVVLGVSQAAAGNYAAGTASATFTVSPVAPTLTFSVPNQTYGVAPFPVSATSNSSGAITYSVVSGPATISNGTVSVNGPGTVVLQASQAAAGNYNAATAKATFTVAQNVSITPITPANTTVAPGVITFNATASGGLTNNLTWSATNSSGGTTGSFSGSVWTSPNVAGTYNITATSVDDPSKLAITTITVSAPVITTQPASANICANAAITFSVAANYAVSYQWYQGSTLLAGATSPSYFIPSATGALDNGTYTVQVTNPAGSVTSNGAILNVGSTITANPMNLTVNSTQTATFSVGVSGVAPFTYQWYAIASGSTTGTPLPGATSVSYTTPAVTSANNGTKYYVVVTDSCGSTLTSTSANLTVLSGNAPPTITQQPANQTTTVGGTPTFTVAATGTGLSYQWYQIPAGSAQGTANAISGATSASYTLPTSATNASDDQDQYYVMITNSYGQAVSFPATLTVGAGISISQQPQSAYINPGDSATFSVVASSTRSLSYQWYTAVPGSSTFQKISGATSASYTVNGGTTAMSGTVFYVIVSNGSVTSPVKSATASLFVTPLNGIPLCSSNWNMVGTTTNIDACTYQLTKSVNNQEGNIVWPTVIATGNIQMQFTVSTNSPSNPPADGFSLVLGDPSLGATPTSQGAVGQGIGAEGIPGFVLVFDDYANVGDPQIPYLGVGRGETALWEKPYTYTNTNIPALAAQNTLVSHNYLVSLVQGYMTVTMDGTQVFAGQVSVPPVAYLYFTASTGGYWETTRVSNIKATVSEP